MAGIRIDWAALESAFENHAPDVSSYLNRETGEIVVVSSRAREGGDDVIRQNPALFTHIDPVASREQYRMMERFIETVNIPALKTQLGDAIVGKGAFRRFKDVVGRHAEERKRWFAFRDVLLHLHVLDWLKQQRVELLEMPDWSLDLPEPLPLDEAVQAEPDEEIDAGVGAPVESRDLTDYLQAWARAHGEEYRYLYGPAAFERLAEDICQEFSFFRRR